VLRPTRPNTGAGFIIIAFMANRKGAKMLQLNNADIDDLIFEDDGETHVSSK
jgi:hypothetical protein